MQIDKLLVQEMRDEVMQALTAIASRHGLNVKQQNNVTYSSIDFGIKYTFSDANVDLAKIEWEKACWKYGFAASDYGKTFEFYGKTIILKRLNTRARKYPVEYTVDGAGKKCSPDFMKIMLAKAG